MDGPWGVAVGMAAAVILFICVVIGTFAFLLGMAVSH